MEVAKLVTQPFYTQSVCVSNEEKIRHCSGGKPKGLNNVRGPREFPSGSIVQPLSQIEADGSTCAKEKEM